MGFFKDLAKLAGENARIKRTANQESSLTPQERQILEDVRERIRQGDSDAMFQLGGYYIHGKYVGYDPSQACHWWTEAANLGHSDAMYNLGILYHGNLSAHYYDENLAGHWFHMAASNGDQEAADMLQQYEYGSFRKKWSKR